MLRSLIANAIPIFAAFLWAFSFISPVRSEAFSYWTYYKSSAFEARPDRDGLHDYGPNISCGPARTLEAYLALDQGRFKIGTPMSLSIFTHSAEFRFVGKIKGYPEGPSPPYLEAFLPPRMAAKFIHEFPIATKIEWALGNSRRNLFTKIGVANAINRLAKECSIPVNTVFDVQRALIWTGFLNSIPNGRIERSTEQAIVKWQRTNGHKATGILSESQEFELANAARRIETEIKWKRHSTRLGFVELNYPGEFFNLPASSEWAVEAHNGPPVELILAIQKEFDVAFAFRKSLTELTTPSSNRATKILEKTTFGMRFLG